MQMLHVVQFYSVTFVQKSILYLSITLIHMVLSGTSYLVIMLVIYFYWNKTTL